jgi:hypothetical protein
MYLPVYIGFIWLALRRWIRTRVSSRIWAPFALGIVLLDLFPVGMSFNPTIAAQHIFPTPEAIRFLQEDRNLYRVSATGLILYPNSGMLFGVSDVRGYDTVVPQRYASLVDQLEGHYRYHFHSLFTEADAPLFDLLNVKYVLTDQELGKKWDMVHQGQGDVEIYHNQDALPRAFVVYETDIVADATQSLEHVLDNVGFRHSVVLEERPLGWAEPSRAPLVSPTVRLVNYEPQQVELEVETTVSGILVLTDNYAPGWKARLDGQLTPVYVANHAFRAITVPAGMHQVEFVYRPAAFWIGAASSLLTGMTSAVLVIRHSYRRHKGRQSDSSSTVN